MFNAFTVSQRKEGQVSPAHMCACRSQPLRNLCARYCTWQQLRLTNQATNAQLHQNNWVRAPCIMLKNIKQTAQPYLPRNMTVYQKIIYKHAKNKVRAQTPNQTSQNLADSQFSRVQRAAGKKSDRSINHPLGLVGVCAGRGPRA